jgi:hypothetical protein
MTKRFAGFIAIFAFFVVCICGLVGDAGFEEVCLRAIVAMAVFYFIGLAVGSIANRILLDMMFGEVPDKVAETIVGKDATAVVKNAEKPARKEKRAK